MMILVLNISFISLAKKTDKNHFFPSCLSTEQGKGFTFRLTHQRPVRDKRNEKKITSFTWAEVLPLAPRAMRSQSIARSVLVSTASGSLLYVSTNRTKDGSRRWVPCCCYDHFHHPTPHWYSPSLMIIVVVALDKCC